MIKYSLFLIGCWCTLQVSAQQIVSSQIQDVTVFLQGAQLTRSTHLSLDAGEQTVVLSGLSPYIDVQSIRSVVAKG